jgi:hypothetical protein
MARARGLGPRGRRFKSCLPDIWFIFENFPTRRVVQVCRLKQIQGYLRLFCATSHTTQSAVPLVYPHSFQEEGD